MSATGSSPLLIVGLILTVVAAIGTVVTFEPTYAYHLVYPPNLRDWPPQFSGRHTVMVSGIPTRQFCARGSNHGC